VIYSSHSNPNNNNVRTTTTTTTTTTVVVVVSSPCIYSKATQGTEFYYVGTKASASTTIAAPTADGSIPWSVYWWIFGGIL
jgi:hypothetical protein